MKRQWLLIMALTFCMLSLVSATNTAITIKTLPGYDVMVQTLNPGKSFPAIQSFYNKSSLENGEITFITSASNTFDVAVWIKQKNRQILYKLFANSYAPGDAITLEMYPEGYIPSTPRETTEVENTTVGDLNETTLEENTTITEAETTQEDLNATPLFSISGNSIMLHETKVLALSTLYYIIGAIFLFVAAFVSMQTLKRRKGKEPQEPKEIKVTKMSDFQKRQEEEAKLKSSDLEEAERKLKEVQEQINKLKNKDKIEAAKQKLIEDQKELMRLREGKE